MDEITDSDSLAGHLVRVVRKHLGVSSHPKGGGVQDHDGTCLQNIPEDFVFLCGLLAWLCDMFHGHNKNTGRFFLYTEAKTQINFFCQNSVQFVQN